MRVIELSFPVNGREILADNGYHLFAALSKQIGEHLSDDVAISSVGGIPLGPRKIGLTTASALRIRTPADRIGALLELAGAFLDVGGHEVQLGVPRVTAVPHSSSLYSRLVCIKGYTEPEPFTLAANRRLEQLGVSGRASVPTISSGPRVGAPRRRVVRIKGVVIVGFAVLVQELEPEDSAQILLRGLGGRRHMGCGIFVPVRASAKKETP